MSVSTALDYRNVPLSLYIHTPWCEQKCPYCDFNSHSTAHAIDEQAYLQALLNDLQTDIASHQSSLTQRDISSVFIGGGTPSQLSADFYKQLIQQLTQTLLLRDEVEITLEANPGSADAERFEGYRAAGINRLSIGVQSLNDSHLKAIGRIHDSEQARHAVQLAQKAGFERINVDMMFGLPSQSSTQAIDELQQAIDLGTEHLSWYQLTIEPNTLFYTQQPPHIMQADPLADCYHDGITLLVQQGFTQYEVSAFARQTSARCEHNMGYWQYHDYIGIGAGAHSKITTDRGMIVRQLKAKQPQQYLQSNGALRLHEKTVPTDDYLFEYLLNRLRLFTPFSAHDFTQLTGHDACTLLTHLAQWQSKDLIEAASVVADEHHSDHQHTQYSLTPKGRRFIDTLTSEVL